MRGDARATALATKRDAFRAEAHVLLSEGRSVEAAERASLAYRLSCTMGVSQHDVLTDCFLLGKAHASSREMEKARQYLGEGMSIALRGGAPDPFANTSMLHIFGRLLHSVGDDGEAEKAHVEFCRRLNVLYGARHVATSDGYNLAARFFLDVGRHDIALEYCGRSLVIANFYLGAQSPCSVRAQTLLALIYRMTNRPLEALRELHFAEAACRFLWGGASLRMAELNLDMGFLEHQLGHLQRALAHYETARDIRAAAPNVGPEHELTSEARQLVSAVNSALRVLGGAVAPNASGRGEGGPSLRLLGDGDGAIGAAARVKRTAGEIEAGIVRANRRNELRRTSADSAAAEGRGGGASAFLQRSAMEPNVALVPNFVANALRNAVRAQPLSGAELRARFAEHAGVVNCVLAEVEEWQFHDFAEPLPAALPSSWVALTGDTPDAGIAEGLALGTSLRPDALNAALPRPGKDCLLPRNLTEMALAEGLVELRLIVRARLGVEVVHVAVGQAPDDGSADAGARYVAVRVETPLPSTLVEEAITASVRDAFRDRVAPAGEREERERDGLSSPPPLAVYDESDAMTDVPPPPYWSPTELDRVEAPPLGSSPPPRWDDDEDEEEMGESALRQLRYGVVAKGPKPAYQRAFEAMRPEIRQGLLWSVCRTKFAAGNLPYLLY